MSPPWRLPGRERHTAPLALDAIAPNPRQPRRRVDDAALRLLADSIPEGDVLPPSDLRPKPACVQSGVFSTNVPRSGCARPETYQQGDVLPPSVRVGSGQR